MPMVALILLILFKFGIMTVGQAIASFFIIAWIFPSSNHNNPD